MQEFLRKKIARKMQDARVASATRGGERAAVVLHARPRQATRVRVGKKLVHKQTLDTS